MAWGKEINQNIESAKKQEHLFSDISMLHKLLCKDFYV